MVNSGSFDSDGQGDRNAKAGLTQPHTAPDSTQSPSPVTASAATSCNSGFSQTADSGLPSVAHAIEPTPTKTEFNCDMPVENFTNLSFVDGEAEESAEPRAADEKTSLCCSLPLEKIQGVLTSYHPPLAKLDDDGAKAAKQPTRKLLCLYCDRSFVSANLRQKHVERIHSAKQNRRVSSRRQNQLTVTPCVYCDKLNGTENTLKDLFQHLINEHSSKYFGCLPCEDRFLTSSLLADHNAISHQSSTSPTSGSLDSSKPEKTTLKSLTSVKIISEEEIEEIPVKITRSKMKPKPEEGDKTKKPVSGNKKKSTKLKELRSKKLSVKSSRIALKRRESKRLQAIAKLTDTQKKKRPRPVEKKSSNQGKMEQTNSTKSTEKIKTNSTCINPYPEFDHFYRVKKITDHSIDNLKISSLTFDDVFDKAFFNRIKCNIEENLLHHIDGKLFKNEESESRISNFEKVSNVPQEIQNANSENFGCELSLNAVTPVASLSLNSQFGEDFESQIEYGSKPSKKKTQPRKDEIHYKYFTRRKYQASILEHKENRDLSKLDMWTQLVIKKRQQKMLDDKKSAREILEYTSCDEYKNKVKREELNRILDRRGPFEDLKEEASKKAALDKLNSVSEDNISEETFTEVREVLNEILNRVFATTEEINHAVVAETEKISVSYSRKDDLREIPAYLNLRRSSSLPSDGEIDKSDKIALICSSQETENFELPTNQVRGKDELIELTGEWARCRMYICAACGAKLPNMRYLLDHKSLYHQNVWVQHYEFVGNQSELYRHLSIPALGKVGAVEESVQCKLWRRSEARLCTKCGKQCNSLGELHRHILECGGDWTWMLARKKCKYRPFGAKSRRKRRGLIHRVHHKQKTEPTEKKTYKKTFEGPRQRPSDADTIQRMLANLPAKRSTRKLISLHDGIYRARKTTQNIKQNKVKCGKVIYKSSTRNETTEKTINAAPTKSQINSSSSRRSLRNLNKVLVSRILDTNATLSVKRKIKALNERRRTRQSQLEPESCKEIINDENLEQSLTTESSSTSKSKLKVVKKDDVEPEDTQPSSKRSSPRSSPKNLKKKMSVKKLLTGKINIKSFFPVKKKKNRNILTENQNPQETEITEVENDDIKTRSKRKFKEPCEEKPEEKKNEVVTVKIDQKKTKHETFSTLVRSFSLRKKKLAKKSIQNKPTEIPPNNININQINSTKEKSEENDQPLPQNDEEVDKIVKKRKLKSSFRNVINKVKKLKIDNTPETTVKAEDVKLNQKIQKEIAFLEESNLEGLSVPVQVEKVIIPSTSETKENTADISTTAPTAINFHDNNENPPIPETIFKLELNNEKSLQAKGELDFDTQPVNKSSETSIEKNTPRESPCKENYTAEHKIDKTQPISIETSVKPKIVPLISPNMKGKIRKPTRGLNDCIAMLTSKLQQKTVEENPNKVDSIFSLLSPSKAPPLFQETLPPKTECILRIPTYRSSSYAEIEETALDLSTKSLRNKELTEKELLCKPLDSYNNLNVVKLNDQSCRGFIVPTFDRTLNKVINSVDQIIEEVVENRIQTIVPQIQQRQWNSVDDIIQKVIDDQRLKLKLPMRNSVDDIIDFVVGSRGSTGNLLNETTVKVDQDFILNKDISIRKIGSIRKPRVKKSSTEILQEIAISKIETNAEKEPLTLNNISITTLDTTNTESLSNAKSVSSKKKNKSQKIIDNVEPTSKGIILDVPSLPLIPNVTKNVPDYTEEINTSCIIENSLQNVESITNTAESSEQVDLSLNDAFIANSNAETMVEKNSTTKAKKGNRKLGQVRNRSRVKKTNETAAIVEPQKKLIETNVDALLDVKEIQSNPVLQCSTNLSTSDESLLTKNDEMKQLPNEDEPHMLENKPVTLQHKPNTLASDSEDDIPLAVLVKSDEKGANLIELESKNKTSNETSMCDETTIKLQNNANLTKAILIENIPKDKSKSELKDDSNTEKLSPYSKDLHKQEDEKDIKITKDIIFITDNNIDKSKIINKPDVICNKAKIEETKVENYENSKDNKEQSKINDIIKTNLSTVTDMLQSESAKQTADIIRDNNSPSYVSEDLTIPQNVSILSPNVESLCESKSADEFSVVKEIEIPLISQPIEVKETAKKSKSLRKERKNVSQSFNNQTQDELISALDQPVRTVDLLENSKTETPSSIKPKVKITSEIDNSQTCFFESAVKNIKNNTEVVQKPKHIAKKSKNRMNKLDVPTESLSNNSLLVSDKVKDELTVQLKPLTQDDYSYNISNFKQNSELNILLDAIPCEDNIEEHTLELKPMLNQSDELSPKKKTKLLKSKGKSKTVKTKIQNKLPNDTTIVASHEEAIKSKPVIVELEKKVPNKKINTERDQNLLIEDEIPLKKLYQNVCNTIVESNKISRESEDVDREIENILFSSQLEIKSKNRAGSSKNRNEKKIEANDPVANKSIDENEVKTNPKKSKGKPSDSKKIDNINDTSNTTDIVIDTNKGNPLSKANDIPTTTFANIKEVSDEAASLHSELDVISKYTQKEPKQPMMKNLEITLELTDVTKSVFSFSSKNVEANKETEFRTVFMKPGIKIKKKRQSKSLSKEPVISNDNISTRNSYDPDDKCISNRSRIRSRLNKPRFRSLKNRSLSNTSSLSEETNKIDISLDLLNKDMEEESIGNKKNISNVKSNSSICIEEKKENGDFNTTLEDSFDINKTDIVLENAVSELEQSYELNSQLPVKRKVKQNRPPTKTSKRTKARGKISQTNKNKIDLKSPEKNISNDVEEAPIVAVIDLLVGSTNVGKEINKIIDPPNDPPIKENGNENIPNKVNEEPPIKIVINKQKTRRKSKSFKKIDLKGQNDLFEDFALVIKKPKRATPIIAFTPVDTFSKDIYPNYLKKPIKETIPLPKVDSENEIDETLAELDSSVEEMDMELDEIPITSNIIERHTKSFLPMMADGFNKIEVETLVQTLDKMESGKQNDEKSTRAENSIQDIPIAELFLSSEKDLALPTEAEVEEFLYETNKKSTKNKEKQNDDLTNKKCKFDSDNKNNTIDDFFGTVQELTKLNFISENMNAANEDAIVPSLVVPSVEGNDKPADNVIDAVISSYSTQTIEDEEKTNSKKSFNKKKKSKIVKNAKVKAPFISTDSENLNIKPVFTSLEPMSALNADNIKDSKLKRSKSTTIAEMHPTEISASVDHSLNDVGKESNTAKDIDSIYAFSESEDFEIETPIEKPKRSTRKQTKSLSESVNSTQDDLVTENLLPSVYDTTLKLDQKDLKPDTECGDVNPKASPVKRRSKLCNLSSDRSIIGEIKENDGNVQEESRKSARSAKVKALEHIHDDALAELTESERNRGIEKDKNSTNDTAAEELTKKRVSRRQSRSQKSLIVFEDLKLCSEPALIPNDNQMLNFHENNANEIIDNLEPKNANEPTEYDTVASVEQLNEKEILAPQVKDSSNQPAKKKNSKKSKANKTQKSKKSLDIFHISTEETEKSLLLKDIANDLLSLEDLEKSIEKELKTDPEMINSSKQLKTKPKQTEESKLSEPTTEETENTDLMTEDNNQELRRSRRGSRKIASYNENDLIDPLLDEIDGKKKIRKKEKVVIEELENKSQRRGKEPEKKLNSDELFDLLKASSNEKNCIETPQTTFCSNADGFSKDFNEHTFQNVFESILDGNDKNKAGKNIESIYEFTDSPENIEQHKDNILTLDVTRKQNKKVVTPAQSKSQSDENSDSVSINAAVSDTRTLVSSTSDILELSMESKSKSIKSDKADLTDKSNYCEICNKKFIRTENLVKHKRTLTHIQKLSEIEAKEAAQKSQSHEPSNNSSKTSIIEITSDSSKVTENLSKSDINIHNILQDSDKPNSQEPTADHTTFPNNHSLKLADIINDVLNKPVLEADNDKHNSFSDIIMQNNVDIQPEYRRYKSLGERKSFDSEPVESRPVPISEPYVSKTTILEKQISLLENIIENQTGVNYIDDISMSSNNSLENNALVSSSELSLKQDDSNTYSRINLTKPNTNDDSFLKPSQYEEISEDSVNLRSYEDQKLRKTLNRDEELFLECCSLLKSGSEMSSYSNKKSQNKVLNTMGLKQCDEPEWLERKSLVEKPLYDVGNEYSDNSRIPTPLGDSYDDDASNSNTITSNWNMNKKVNVFEDISQDKEDDANKSFSFQEILIEDEGQDKNKGSISKFGEILSKTVGVLPKAIKRTSTVPVAESCEKKQEELGDGSTSENKKIITKGARKVFEGLKVSIPTEELNLEEVLNCSPKSKKLDIASMQNSGEKSTEQSLSSVKPPRTARKSKPVKNKSQFGSNLLFKMKKKKIASPASTNKNDEDKAHDIYDFEETQDNTDVFTKPDFRAFRNMKSSEAVPEPDSETDSRDYLDSFSYEAQSITSSISSSSSKKPKTQESITKKKCMIMGRIFKNAAKSKIEDIDEEIRDIPSLNNCELVKNYVADCKKIIRNEEVAKPKLSEKEIDQLFDQLLEDRVNNHENTEVKTCIKSKTDVVKKTDNKKKVKPKNKKRTRTNSDSTDDEFSLNKNGKKRAYRKNAKAEDNCINLEQELKECIGVASRKSQRKCTSGKQNVLVEYWSSDDSQFEALLESQRIEVKQPINVAELNKTIEPEPVLQVSEVVADDNTAQPDNPLDVNGLEKHKSKCMEKKPQQKRKLSSEKKPKLTTPGTEKTADGITSNRRKRAAVNPLYHWSSSSEDESQDLIEVKPLRDELEDDEDRPIQHGWIVGDSPKKLVTMLAQAKGKKTDIDCVKEQGKKRTNAVS